MVSNKTVEQCKTIAIESQKFGGFSFWNQICFFNNLRSRMATTYDEFHNLYWMDCCRKPPASLCALEIDSVEPVG
ncbi:hypothetical protein PHET_02752 [Paragonimus heterotremus]|uniref:Uncharacterized protein n=1 Tax=Paragonimus heterotremus TaxID=100268 RepID=A0A8J4SRU6_9TREM|nr:hypothetical protein PHET_02752 [Paragonimus heterotremus]